MSFSRSTSSPSKFISLTLLLTVGGCSRSEHSSSTATNESHARSSVLAGNPAFEQSALSTSELPSGPPVVLPTIARKDWPRHLTSEIQFKDECGRAWVARPVNHFSHGDKAEHTIDPDVLSNDMKRIREMTDEQVAEGMQPVGIAFNDQGSAVEYRWATMDPEFVSAIREAREKERAGVNTVSYGPGQTFEFDRDALPPPPPPGSKSTGVIDIPQSWKPFGGGVEPDNIVPGYADYRRWVEQNESWPSQSQLYITDAEQGSDLYGCSGTNIGPRTSMTAAHCVFSNVAHQWLFPRQLRARWTMSGTSAYGPWIAGPPPLNLSYGTCVLVFTPAGYQQTSSDNGINDYALIDFGSCSTGPGMNYGYVARIMASYNDHYMNSLPNLFGYDGADSPSIESEQPAGHWHQGWLNNQYLKGEIQRYQYYYQGMNYSDWIIFHSLPTRDGASGAGIISNIYHWAGIENFYWVGNHFGQQAYGGQNLARRYDNNMEAWIHWVSSEY